MTLVSKFFVRILFLTLMFVSLVILSGNVVVSQDFNIKVDDRIINELENKTMAPVIVILKDTTGISYHGSKSERVSTLEQKKKQFSQMQASVLSSLPLEEFKIGFVYSVTNGFSGNITTAGLTRLIKNPAVQSINFDYKDHVLLDESRSLIGADKSAQLNPPISGNGQTVCVIDTGVDYTHPDLGGCNSSQFLSGTCSKVISGYDYYNLDNDPIDDEGHGTNVAGVVISTNSSYKGIAPEAKVVALKVCNQFADDCPISKQIAAMNWCIDNSTKFNISVISMSLGGETGHHSSYCNDDARATTVNTAVGLNIAMIFASGNDANTNAILAPACIENSTSVGASYDEDLGSEGIPILDCFNPSTKPDQITCYSDRAQILDLLAPGSRITTTKKGGGFENTDGTSLAAPHVASVIALLSQMYSNLTVGQIETALKDSGIPIWDSYSKRWYPRVDAYNALWYVNFRNISHADWPTDHHDYRRTGFTLLKGDVNKASDIDASNVALKDTISSDILIRPSVADLDGNGHQDVVTVMYELGAGNSNGSDVYAVERRPKIFNKWWMDTKERWHTNVPVSYPLLPPTLANLDSDSNKEVLMGLENGTLIAYDITSGGKDQVAVEKWIYKFVAKYSAQAGTTFVRFGGGTAVGDIDLDGNQEILTADMGNRGTPDWPGEVFIIDGITGIKEGNATFGNGGAFASVSVANIDSDDNPEIIVPSFYGVYVYDYNSSAPNKLTLKCSTSDGMIDGSVVVYDVDRDNQYELVYTTTTLLCDQSKTCYNRLYIKNAQTCANEGPSPISLSVYSRVTPTIANLDSDSNYEIVISGRLNTQTEDGKIMAYDATTGAQQWSYDDSGTLKTAFVAPDIADMNGDGMYDIVFGENNGTKVHIVNSSGGKNFTYNFNAFIDSALAIADIDGDGKAEIALKREGSPYGILAIAGSFNRPPQLGNISNVTARFGDLIDLNRSGEILASDPDGNALTFSFSAPFNSSGKWQTTVNDTGNYSIFVEVSDGSLTDFVFVDVYVFNQSTKLVGNFSDGSSSKLLNYASASNNTVSVRLPKNATIVYSRIRLEGRGS